MKKVIVITSALIAALVLTAFTAGWTQRQSAAHEIAEMARSMGLPEDNPIIEEASRLWWAEEANFSGLKLEPEEQQCNFKIDENLKLDIPEISGENEENGQCDSESEYSTTVITLEPEDTTAYTEEELNILAKLIWKEAGGCPWEHMCTVGCVVLNRVSDERFPDSIYDVVAQPRQYSGSYLYGFENTPDECYDAARAVLEGEYTIPENVVWQANFPQGSGTWWTSFVDTGWFRSTTYFCY